MSGQTPRTRSQVTLLLQNPYSHDEFDYETPSEWASTIKDCIDEALTSRSWCLEITPIATGGSSLSVQEGVPEDMCLIFDVEYPEHRDADRIERAIRASLEDDVDAKILDVSMTPDF